MAHGTRLLYAIAVEPSSTLAAEGTHGPGLPAEPHAERADELQPAGGTTKDPESSLFAESETRQADVKAALQETEKKIPKVAASALRTTVSNTLETTTSVVEAMTPIASACSTLLEKVEKYQQILNTLSDLAEVSRHKLLVR